MCLFFYSANEITLIFSFLPFQFKIASNSWFLSGTAKFPSLKCFITPSLIFSSPEIIPVEEFVSLILYFTEVFVIEDKSFPLYVNSSFSLIVVPRR